MKEIPQKKETNNKTLCAEIISIGDELTSGSIVDTNSAWLSKALADLGIRTCYHTTTADDALMMNSVLTIAARRADLVLVTGGLGPTEDDLTRQIIAQVAGVELVRDDASLDYIRLLFQKRNRVMPDSNLLQAYFPKGSQIVPNPQGTAPGFAIPLAPDGDSSNGALVIAMPGVPAEMKVMWNGTVMEMIRNWMHQKLGKCPIIRYHSIHCFGAGESQIEDKLPHLIHRDHIPRVGITAAAGIITLRICAISETEEDCQKMIAETSKVIYDNVGEYIFGENGATLPMVTAKLLQAKGEKLGIIEWGTQGVAARAADPSTFVGGLVDSPQRPVYSLLHLPEGSEPETILRTFGKTIGANAVIAIGPYPQCEEEAPEKRHVRVCALYRDQYQEESFIYGFHPAIIDSLFTSRAFDLLRRMMNR